MIDLRDLRDTARMLNQEVGWEFAVEELNEAADEIERLREALEGVREYVDENEYILTQEQKFILRVIDNALKGASTHE